MVRDLQKEKVDVALQVIGHIGSHRHTVTSGREPADATYEAALKVVREYLETDKQDP